METPRLSVIISMGIIALVLLTVILFIDFPFPLKTILSIIAALNWLAFFVLSYRRSLNKRLLKHKQ